MDQLYSQIENNIRQIVRLRGEVANLEEDLKKISASQEPQLFTALQEEIGKTTKKIEELAKAIEQAEGVITARMQKIAGAIDIANLSVEDSIKVFRAYLGEQMKALGGIEIDMQSDQNTPEEQTFINQLYEEQLQLVREIKEELAGIEECYSILTSKSEEYLGQIRTLKTEQATMPPEKKQDSSQGGQIEINLQIVQMQYQAVQHEQEKLKITAAQYIQDMVEGLSDVSDCLSIAEKGTALLGGNTEKLVVAQQKLQTAISVVNAVQQTANVLRSTASSISKVFTNTTRLLGAAQMWLAATLGISTVAAQALMATLTLGLSVAITAVISLLSAYIFKQKEEKIAQEEAMEAAKRRAEAEKEVQRRMASSMAEQITNYKRLQTAYNELGDDMKKKNQFITDNQKQFDKLGVSINSVTEAENLLINNEDAFIKSMANRALAAASMELAKEEYTKAIQKMMEAENYKFTAEDQQAATASAQKKMQASLPAAYRNPEIFKIITTDKGKNNKDSRIKVYRNTYESILAKEIEDRRKSQNTQIETEAREFISKADGIMKVAAGFVQKSDMELDNANINKKKSAGTTPKSSVNYSSLEKHNQDIIRSEEDMQNQLTQEGIDLMDEGSKKVIAQMELNFERELQTIDRQKEDLLRKKIDDARSAFETDPANTGKNFDSSKVTLSDKKTKQFDGLYKNAIARQGKTNKEYLETQRDSIREYLKEYGTFQQKKLAIAEEYAEKIRKAEGNQGEVMRLEKQQNAAIVAVETAAIKAEMDWPAALGGFGGMFKDMIKPTLEKAERYTKTDEFKNADQTSQKELIDAINQTKESLDSSGELNFKKLGQDVQAYQHALRSLQLATDNEINAQTRLKKAQEDHEKALKDGTKAEQEAAAIALNEAQLKANMASRAVEQQTGVVKQSRDDVADTAKKLDTAMKGVTEGLSKLASGGVANAIDGFLKMKDALSKSSDSAVKSLEDLPLVGWIASIIDILKDGLSNLIGGLIDSVFNAVNGIIGDVLSGDLFVTIGKSIATGVQKIFDSISFGGFSSLKASITGSNAKEVAETTNRLTSSNKILQQSIDALKSEMEKARGMDTVKAYDDAVEKQKELIQNTGKILGAQMSYSNSHHSNNYYINRSMSQNDWDRVSDKVGKKVSNVSDLWSLSPEDLKKVSTLTDVWDKIYNGGKYDKSGYLDQYIALADTLDELETKLNETLTQISFDSIYSNFIDTLMNMNASAEDFADNLSEYFMRAMLSNQIGTEYSKLLEGWYKEFAGGMKKEGGLTDDERKALKDEYMGYVDAALKERDELAAIIGYGSESSTTQESTSKGFETMSQDTGEELNGRFTALQMAGEEIKNQNLLQTEILALNGTRLDTILTSQSELTGIADETRGIIANSYLELQGICENTGAIVKPIKNMSEKLDNIERKIQTI